ncbi:MAG: CoA-binding protein [Aquificaceae bacterium]|nr:CoA-binding protein [Aquificaceae bacterium]MDW8028698.1 CoA-binding protein [Armatimonadota bacterium]
MSETQEFCEIPTVNANEEEIERLLKEAKVVAVVGVSRDPTKDSHIVAKYLSRHYRTYFINPYAEEIDGQKVYPSLKDLPEVPDIVDIFRAPSKVPPIVDEAIEIGAKAVWMQVGIVNNEAAQKAKEAGLTVIQNKCMMVEHKKLKDAGKL